MTSVALSFSRLDLRNGIAGREIAAIIVESKLWHLVPTFRPATIPEFVVSVVAVSSHSRTVTTHGRRAPRGLRRLLLRLLLLLLPLLLLAAA